MRNKGVRLVLFVLAGSVFLFSLYKISEYLLEMRAGSKQNEALIQMAVVTVPRETESTPQVESTDDTTSEEEIPRVIAPIQVDFESLRKENPDVIGWLYCADTKINYPVVQGEDNEYYLHRLLDGTSNASGTLFLDYRNEADLSDWNSVIYGHNMKNKTMFGSVTGYKKQAYYDEHPEMYLLTPERDYLIKLVAGVVTKSDSDVFNEFNPSDGERATLLQNWLDASTFVSQIEPNPNDRFITLSTCSYEYSNARFVLIGVIE